MGATSNRNVQKELGRFAHLVKRDGSGSNENSMNSRSIGLPVKPQPERKFEKVGPHIAGRLLDYDNFLHNISVEANDLAHEGPAGKKRAHALIVPMAR